VCDGVSNGGTSEDASSLYVTVVTSTAERKMTKQLSWEDWVRTYACALSRVIILVQCAHSAHSAHSAHTYINPRGLLFDSLFLHCCTASLAADGSAATAPLAEFTVNNVFDHAGKPQRAFMGMVRQFPISWPKSGVTCSRGIYSSAALFGGTACDGGWAHGPPCSCATSLARRACWCIG
jgi:hypothetical protein